MWHDLQGWRGSAESKRPQHARGAQDQGKRQLCTRHRSHDSPTAERQMICRSSRKPRQHAGRSPRNRLFSVDHKKYIPGQYRSNRWRLQPNNNKTAHLAVTTDTYRPLHHNLYRSTFLIVSYTPPFSAMHFSSLLSLASLAALGSSQNTSLPDYPEPVAPGLTFLYTSLVECQNGLYKGPPGPRGIRTAIPILGGNVTGPRIKGAPPISYSLI